MHPSIRAVVLFVVGVFSAACAGRTDSGDRRGIAAGNRSVDAGSVVPAKPAGHEDVDLGDPSPVDPDAPDASEPDSIDAAVSVEPPDSDASAAADVAPDDGVASPLATGPAVGDLAITEVMATPSGPDPVSEWFEIGNLSGTPQDLRGLKIVDGYGDEHVVSAPDPVVVQPGAFVVVARSRAAVIADGIPAAAVVYEYGAGLDPDEGIELDAGTWAEISLWNGPIELAYVPYGGWSAPARGQSIELSAQDYAGSALPRSWCFASSPWTRGSDWGTPGEASDCL